MPYRRTVRWLGSGRPWREPVLACLHSCFAGPARPADWLPGSKKNRSASATAVRALPPEPEDPTPGTLVPNPGNPPLHVFEPNEAENEKAPQGPPARRGRKDTASTGRPGDPTPLRGWTSAPDAHPGRLAMRCRPSQALGVRLPSRSAKGSMPTSTTAGRAWRRRRARIRRRSSFNVDFEGAEGRLREGGLRGSQPRNAAGPDRKSNRDRTRDCCRPKNSTTPRAHPPGKQACLARAARTRPRSES